MYRLGVLSREEVKKAYKDLGYNDENAERLTEFTVRYETTQDRDLSKSEILRGYREKIFSDDEARTLLEQLGYSTAEANYLIALEALKEQHELEELALRTLKQQYLQGLIIDTDARAEMAELGLSAKRIDLEIQKWRLEREERRALPSKSDILDWLSLGIINEDEAKNRLYQLGYSWEDADKYIKAVKLKSRG